MQGIGDRVYMMKGTQHDRFFHHTSLCDVSFTHHCVIRAVLALDTASDFSLRSSWSVRGWFPMQGTSAWRSSLSERLISQPLDQCLLCFIVCCMIVVCYCTVITQIYDGYCYKFGGVFILPNCDNCDWRGPGIPTTIVFSRVQLNRGVWGFVQQCCGHS